MHPPKTMCRRHRRACSVALTDVGVKGVWAAGAVDEVSDACNAREIYSGTGPERKRKREGEGDGGATGERESERVKGVQAAGVIDKVRDADG